MKKKPMTETVSVQVHVVAHRHQVAKLAAVPGDIALCPGEVWIFAVAENGAVVWTCLDARVGEIESIPAK